MTVSEYVPRDINVIPPTNIGDSLGSVHGIENPLDVADGLTGYTEQERTVNIVPPDVREVTTFRIERASGPAPSGTITDLWYEIEYQVSGAFLSGLTLAAVTPAGTALSGNGANRPTTWTRYTLAGNLDESELQAVLDPATWFSIDGTAQTFNTTGLIQVTYLRVFIEHAGIQPLAWRQHDFTGIAARGLTSYWQTNRARGKL